MLKSNKEMQVANACYAMVSGEFARFINPNNRGLTFNWELWVERVSEKCRVEIWLYIPIPKNEQLKDDISEAAAKFGLEIAKRLVSYAGFVDMN